MMRPAGRIAGHDVEDRDRSARYDARLVRRLLGYLSPYRRDAALAGLALVASAVLQIVAPLVTQAAVDLYLAPVRTSALPTWLPVAPAAGVAALSACYLAAILGAAALDASQAWLTQRAGQRAMSDLRRDLLARLQALDMAWFDRHPSGQLVTRVTTDVDALNDLLTSGLVAILADLVMLVSIAVVMIALSPRLSLVVFAILPFVVLATLAFRRQAASSYRRIRASIGRINAFLAEHFSGMSVVQLFNRQRERLDRFAEVNADNRRAHQDAVVAMSWFTPVVEFQGMLAVAALLAFGGWSPQSSGVSLGVLVAFFQYALRFFRPIQELSDKYNVLQAAIAASEKIFALLDTPITVPAPAHPVALGLAPGAIEFDHVWFAYTPGAWVLRDVSFTIPAGHTAAIVGHTGAGKTTITNLLLRFYDVHRGAIRVGGVDIRELDPRDLRRRFGVVLQDAHLFHGTLADNVRLGATHLSDEDVRAALARVALDGVSDWPDGAAAPVREGGPGLSLGQKQLLAIARAVVREPAYLILDEATSAVDTPTERRIQHSLVRLLRGRTAVVIAHRLSTIRRADRILVMHHGALHESGTHAELLARRGLYWQMHVWQHGRRDDAAAEPLAPIPPAASARHQLFTERIPG